MRVWHFQSPEHTPISLKRQLYEFYLLKHTIFNWYQTSLTLLALKNNTSHSINTQFENIQKEGFLGDWRPRPSIKIVHIAAVIVKTQAWEGQVVGLCWITDMISGNIVQNNVSLLRNFPLSGSFVKLTTFLLVLSIVSFHRFSVILKDEAKEEIHPFCS